MQSSSSITSTSRTRTALALLGACLATVTVIAPVYGQAWPTKPVRWIVPFPPGGGVDVTARTLAQRLSAALGQQFIIDNRGGANGNVGVELATRAAADGHTLLMATTGNITINPHLYAKLNFDPLRDLAPVTPAVDVINALVVHPSLPVRTVQELVALAKRRPGEINYGSSGPGGSDHIATELFASLSGTKLTNISYKGGAPAMVDLVAGNIQMMIAVMAVAVGPIQSGRVRPLAVTSAKRFELMPQVPTVVEAGVPGYEASFWFGTFAPAATPKEIVARQNAEIRKVLQIPEVRQRLLESGLVATGGGADEFATFVAAESKKWAKLVVEKGIRVE